MFWFRIIISILILLFGISTTRSLSYKWIIVGIFLYSIPLWFQITNRPILKLMGIWVGIFLVTQSLISPFIMERQLKTLKPFMDKTWDVRGGIPGIEGIQHITTDSKGFRVTKEIDYNQKKGYRIFVMGASSTEQIFLDDHKTWTHLLQKEIEDKLNYNIEIINTAVSGTRVPHNYSTFREIIKYKPDMVVFYLGMTGDSYYQILTYYDPFYIFSFDSTLLGKKIKHLFDQLKKGGTKESPKVEIVYGDEYERKRGSLTRITKKIFRPKSVSKTYSEYLHKIIDLCKKNDITCVFIIQRCGYQESASEEFKKGFWMTPPETQYTLDFESLVYISELYSNYTYGLATEKGIYVVNIAKEIPPSYEFMYDDCHLNVNGAQRVSDALYKFLIPIIENHKSLKKKI